MTASKKIILLSISLFIVAMSFIVFSISQFYSLGAFKTLPSDVLWSVIKIIITLVAAFILFFIALFISLIGILKKNVSKPMEEVIFFMKQIINSGNLDYLNENKFNADIKTLAKVFNSIIGIMEVSRKSLIDTIEETKQIKRVMVDSLASLVEMRDNKIGQHNKRTQEYVRVLAVQLKKTNNKYKEVLTDSYIEILLDCTPLHDIGKITIPDSILFKPGKLTDEEFEIMKTHTTVGYEALNFQNQRLCSNEFVKVSREIAHSHHERWDGTGYPNGLKGKEIPLCARIVAVADVYDALVTNRVYKAKFSYVEAKNEIVRFSGMHFDPDIIEAFVEVEEKMVEISQKYQ